MCQGVCGAVGSCQKDAKVYPNLRTGDPDASSLKHGLTHLIKEYTEVVIEVCNFATRLAQAGVRVFDDAKTHVGFLEKRIPDISKNKMFGAHAATMGGMWPPFPTERLVRNINR